MILHSSGGPWGRPKRSVVRDEGSLGPSSDADGSESWVTLSTANPPDREDLQAQMEQAQSASHRRSH